MTTGPVVAGGTYKWTATFLKNGAIYDLTGATVTINFYSALSIMSSFSMTILSASAGTAEYTNAITLFTNANAGDWVRSHKVSVSGVVLESVEIPFKVHRSIAGL